MAERVLITGARSAAALDLARDFAAAGWDVHLADSSPALIARCSRAVARLHRYPPPAREPAGFRQSITRLLDRLGPVLVVPTCEEVFHLAAPALGHALRGRLFAPPLPLLRRLHDKLAFARACADWGLPVPESHAIDSQEDLAVLLPESRHWVFKPRFSRFGELALVGPTMAELARIAPQEGWMAQRRIRGSEASFYAVARDGRLLAFAGYQSEWRLGGGASFAFTPLEGALSDRLQAIAARLASAAGISGQFSCDAMIDAHGAPHLIECNPRATSGLHLLAGQGLLAAAMAEGTAIPASALHPAHLGPAMVAYGLPAALRDGRLGHWWQALLLGRDVIGRPGDRLPLAGALLDAALFTLQGWRHGISTTAATTRDLEWNGEDLA